MSDRMTGVVAAALGVLAAIGIVLLFMVLSGDGETELTAATTTTSTTTTIVTTTEATTTTAATTTTEATTTTAATTTTTEAPFFGDLEAKNCDATGSPNAGTITDVRFAEHDGFTRIVFDFSGEVPGCFVSQIDTTTISVLVIGVAGDPPYEAGIFDASGDLAVGLGSVIEVIDAGMGAGSGEWTFHITTFEGNRIFSIFTLEDPSRLAVDIGN
ncbi:MAG: hypothetical protein HZA58_10350 [Acidimicrobiia bacterium]|nr:hypothetical protein [Acidimicrobiia bacterium]